MENLIYFIELQPVLVACLAISWGVIGPVVTYMLWQEGEGPLLDLIILEIFAPILAPIAGIAGIIHSIELLYTNYLTSAGIAIRREAKAEKDGLNKKMKLEKQELL